MIEECRVYESRDVVNDIKCVVCENTNTIMTYYDTWLGVQVEECKVCGFKKVILDLSESLVDGSYIYQRIEY